MGSSALKKLIKALSSVKKKHRSRWTSIFQLIVSIIILSVGVAVFVQFWLTNYSSITSSRRRFGEIPNVKIDGNYFKHVDGEKIQADHLL